MLAHAVDHRADLAGGALPVCVDRPEIQLLQDRIAGRTAEGALTGDQPTVIFRQGGNVLRDRFIVVHLSARFGDRDGIAPLTCHVARHVGDDGDGGDDLRRLLREGGQQVQQGCHKKDTAGQRDGGS